MAPLYTGAGDQLAFTADYRNRDNDMIYQANPPNAPGAKQSADLEFSVADAADADVLNAILWRATKGNIPMPRRSIRFSRLNWRSAATPMTNRQSGGADIRVRVDTDHAPASTTGGVPLSLERAQEFDNLLLLLSAQLIEMFDDLICLAASASVSSDGTHQVARPSVMEKEDTLPYAPEGSGTEFVGAGAALRDVVGEAFAHVVDGKVREKIHRLIGQRSTWVGRGAARNRCAGGWGQHPHEVGKCFDV
jgi:hypothetical protein